MVRPHDLAHDREAEPGARSRTIPPAPEAIENVLARVERSEALCAARFGKTVEQKAREAVKLQWSNGSVEVLG